MINKLLDLKRYLCLLYKKKFEVTVLNYQETFDVLNVYRKSDIDSSSDFHFLNSNFFSKLFQKNKITFKNALITFLRILKKIQLYYVMRETMNLDKDKVSIIIKSQILSYSIKTIDILMNIIQLTYYVQIHQSLTNNLKIQESALIIKKEE